MRKIRLRTKFLISLLAVSAGLTAATLFTVSYSVEKRIRDDLRVDLENSVNNYRRFEHQRRESLVRSAQLLAGLPNIRALMTTHDRAGNIAALRTKTGGLSQTDAQALLRKSLDTGEDRGWWFGGGHLYETWVQPIYFGAPGA